MKPTTFWPNVTSPFIDYWGYRSENGGRLDARHLDSLNVGFADGHVTVVYGDNIANSDWELP